MKKTVIAISNCRLFGPCVVTYLVQMKIHRQHFLTWDFALSITSPNPCLAWDITDFAEIEIKKMIKNLHFDLSDDNATIKLIQI